MGPVGGHDASDPALRTPEATAPHDAATIIGPEHAADSTRASPPGFLASEQLVFGIIALQHNFLSREQLVDAFAPWLHEKSRTLADILEAQGALSPADRQLAEQLTARLMAEHGGVAERSLGALASFATVRPELERLNDADLSVSLSRVETAFSADAQALGSQIQVTRSSERFKILRPHAKGGLGQVSVALDRELNREVALKEIQTRHADDPVSRERFVLEAEITGGLEHPGIVPVYSLGQGPEGRPFYAMRFIRGDSLKQAIESFHDPANPQRHDPGARQIALRQLLARFIAICDAVEYAHSRGVLHRDLKPANVMMGKYGETLVVDWGLAKSVDKPEVAADETLLRSASALSSSGHTMPGSAIGTPAYMSPEQAAGRLDEIGPASDIYSLGATLYHLLCGRPPFMKEDLASIRLKVERQDFPRPRSIAAEIPRALEAVCLKAMSCDVGDRYQTARGLADDLEHWLADEPVSALPETAVQSAARWTRRHRAWALAAAAALAVVAVVSTGAAVRIEQARRNEQTALLAAERNAETARLNADAARQNEELAKAHAQTAVQNALTAKQNEELANQNAAVARQATIIADRNAQVVKDQFRKTVASVLELGGQLEKRLRDVSLAAPAPEPSALRKELFNMFGDNLLRLGRNVQETGITDFAMASTYDQMGEVLLRFGRGGEALRYFEEGRKLVEQAALDRPADDVARANLALLTMKIGKTCLDVDDDARAGLKNFLKSCDLQLEIMTNPRGDRYKPADNRRLLSMYEIQAGVAELRLGRPRQALAHFQASLELRKAWLEESTANVAAYSYVSECYLWLGILAWHLEDAPGVAANFGECLRICHELAEKFPNDASFLGDLAEVYGSLGDAQMRLGKSDDARTSYAKSREFLSLLRKQKPDDASSLPLLAQTWERAALIAAQGGDSVKARENYDLALKVRNQMAELDPANLQWLAARALTLAHCGLIAEAAEQAAALMQRAPESSTAQLQAARCLAVCSEASADAAHKRQYVERALTAVAAAARGEFEDAALLTTDLDLASLRQEPAFQSLLETLKKK